MSLKELLGLFSSNSRYVRTCSHGLAGTVKDSVVKVLNASNGQSIKQRDFPLHDNDTVVQLQVVHKGSGVWSQGYLLVVVSQ